MQHAVLIVFALVMGVASVELFVRAWKGLLGCLASMVLLWRKSISWKQFLSRLHEYFAIALLCSLSLTLCFRVYLVTYGLGKTEIEQLAYFIACMVRMAPMLSTLSADISAMFETENKK